MGSREIQLGKGKERTHDLGILGRRNQTLVGVRKLEGGSEEKPWKGKRWELRDGE